MASAAPPVVTARSPFAVPATMLRAVRPVLSLAVLVSSLALAACDPPPPPPPPGTASGARVFASACAACHHPTRRLVGPALTDIARQYGSDRDGIARWVRAPGRHRPDYPAMPGFPYLTPVQLDDVARYVLAVGHRGR